MMRHFDLAMFSEVAKVRMIVRLCLTEVAQYWDTNKD